MEKKKRVKFTTNIDEELLKRIKIKAIKEGKNVNEIIEELLEKYLSNERRWGSGRCINNLSSNITCFKKFLTCSHIRSIWTSLHLFHRKESQT